MVERARKAILVLVLASSAAACSDTPTGYDVNDTGPLTQLEPCSTPPPAGPQRPAALLLPPGSIVTSIKRKDELRHFKGYVELTPIAIRLFYEKQGGLEVFTIEDEVYEAEVFFSTGKHRIYLKASGSCQTGSELFGVLADEKNAGAVPTPTGKGGG